MLCCTLGDGGEGRGLAWEEQPVPFITGRQEGGAVRDPISATGKEEAERKLAECKL